MGEWGTVMHHDGTRWTRELAGNETLNRVWPRAKDDVWVIGDQGFVAHRDASGWKQVPSKTTVTLSDIDGLAGDDVWIAGDTGIALHWDGREIQQRRVAESSLLAVLPLSKEVIWFSTSQGVFAWNDTTSSTTKTGDIAAVDLHRDGWVWAVDAMGQVLRWDSYRWTDQWALVDDRNARARFVRANFGMWVLGQRWVVEHRRAQWLPIITVGQSFSVGTSAFASTRDDKRVLAVGSGGRIARWIGPGPHPQADDEWQVERGSPFVADVQAIWSDDGAVVVASRNLLLPGSLGRWRGGAVELDETYRLVKPSPDEHYIADHNGVHHFDGKTLETRLTSISSPWAVGDDKILRLVSNKWIAVEHPKVDVVTQVWSVSPTLAWATGARDGNGVILRWDGRAWVIVQELADEEATRLVGFDAMHAWLATAKGLRAWDGTSWAPAKGWPEQTAATEISVVGPDDLWVASSTPLRDGDSGTQGYLFDRQTQSSSIAHWDGTTWTSEPIGIEITAIHARRDSVWIGGRVGALLKRTR